VKYKEISRSQSIYEARMARALDKATVPTTGDVQLPENTPWAAITALPILSDFLRPPGNRKGCYTTDYGLLFLASLDDATQQLRTALNSELG
jgi:hypothetical protein